MGSYRTLQTVRDKLQIAAFKSIFRCNPDLDPETRLVHAILATCDDALAVNGKETLIEKWINVYGENSTSTLLDDMGTDRQDESERISLKVYRV